MQATTEGLLRFEYFEEALAAVSEDFLDLAADEVAVGQGAVDGVVADVLGAERAAVLLQKSVGEVEERVRCGVKRAA